MDRINGMRHVLVTFLAILTLAMSTFGCNPRQESPMTSTGAVSESPPPPPPPKNPIVTDTEGKTYEVASLRAKFSAGGMWIGSRPTDKTTRLPIDLAIKVDRIMTHETVEIPFESIRLLTLDGAEVPDAVKDQFADVEPMRVDRRDGSIVLLSRSRYVELDAEGKVTRSTPIDSYSIETGEAQGMSISIDGFEGRATTAEGKQGDFWISMGETKSIDFR